MPIVPIGWAVAPSLLVRIGEAHHFLFWSVYSGSPVWYVCSVLRMTKAFSTSLNMLSISHAEEALVGRHEVQWIIYWRKCSSSCLFRQLNKLWWFSSISDFILVLFLLLIGCHWGPQAKHFSTRTSSLAVISDYNFHWASLRWSPSISCATLQNPTWSSMSPY